MYLFTLFASLFSRRSTAVKCGHRTRASGRVSAFNRSIVTHMRRQDGALDYCLDCLGKMAIQCGCGQAIFIGDPVALYYHTSYPMTVPVFGHGPAYIGCMHCSDSGANLSGFWVPGEDGKGQVKRIPNGYEIALDLGVSLSSS